jgi:WD40 repeat protein
MRIERTADAAARSGSASVHTTASMSTLFISHSSLDNEAAERLRARLAEQGHQSVFLDFDPERGIRAGASWEQTLYTKLRACRAVVALLTDNYLASQWCFAEVALARMEGKEIFALRMEPWSEQTRLPSILTEHQLIDLRTGQDEDEAYRRLRNGFKARGIVPREHREWGPEDSPYPGLRAFEEKDAPIFFGRETEILAGVELLNRVRRQGYPRLVMVLGSSGSGKSSLARAGIVPRLRRDAERWRVVGPFRPGRRPARELAAAFAQAFREAGQAQLWEELCRKLLAPAEGPEPAPESPPGEEGELLARERLLEALRTVEGELSPDDQSVVLSVRRLQRFLGESPSQEPGRPPKGPAAPGSLSPLVEIGDQLRLVAGPSEAGVLLVIDQLEELLGHDGEGPNDPANRFLKLLKAGIEAEGSPIMALGTMRSDFLGVLQRSAHFQGVGFKSLSVGPMSTQSMHQIIVGPAELGAIELDRGTRGEKGLVERLLGDTGTADALPLLAFTLRVMWDKYVDFEKGDRTLRNRDYEGLGGLQGAIVRIADETLEAALHEGTEKDLQSAFLSLARPTEQGTGWSRQPASWDQFPERVRPMLQRFIDQRLLVKRADGTVEVAHEALFRSWGKLRGWLWANAEGLLLLREIRSEAEKWRQAGCDQEKEPYLWRAGRLARALELRDGGVLSLEDLDRSFLEASDQAERARLAAEEARRRRAFRLTLAGAVAALVLAVLAVLFGVRAHQARIRAVNEEVRTRAHSSIALYQAERPFEALLEAVETGRRFRAIRESDREPGLRQQVESALLQALSGVTLKNAWKAHDAWPNALVASRDGSLLLSAGYDTTIRRWRPDGTALAPLKGHETAIFALALSPDASVIVSGDQDGTIRFWREGPDPIRSLKAHQGIVRALAFHPSGRFVASGGSDGAIRFWSPEGAGRQDLEAQQPVASLAFSSDGKLLLSGDETGSVTWWAPADGNDDASQAGPWQPRKTLHAHDGTVHSLSFAVGDEIFASAGEDGAVKVWTAAGSPRDAYPGSGSAPVYVARFAPSDGTLFAAGADRRLRIWRRAGRFSALIGDDHDEPVTGLAFARDGELVATASRDLRIKLWRAGTNPFREDLTGHAGPVQEIDVSPDGELIASAGDDRTVRLWSPGGVLLKTLPPEHTSLVRSLRFSPDGRRLAAAGHDGRVIVWQVPEGRKVLELPVQEKGVNQVDFSPDGRWLLAAGLDGRIRLHGAEDGGPGKEFPRQGDSVWGVRFSGDGFFAVSLPSPPMARIHALDGSREPVELTRHGDCGHDQGVLRTAFSADGRWVATAAGTGNAVLWSRDGTCRKVLEGHGRGVNAVAFSPDSRWLVTAGLNGEIRIWDSATGELYRSLLGHRGGVTSAVFTEQGGIVSGSTRGEIIIWKDIHRDLDVVMKQGSEWIADYRRLHGAAALD